LALVEEARYCDAVSGRHVSRGDEGFNPYAELSGIERVACYYFGALNALNPIEWGKGIYGAGKHLVQNRFSSQSFKDVLGGMLEGMKFWNKQDPFEQAQSFVGDALLALGAAKGISAAGTRLKGAKVETPVPKVGSTPAGQAGKAAHKAFTQRVRSKPGWEPKVRIQDETGKWVEIDAVTPSGNPIELKPNTPTGRAKGRIQIRKYEDVTRKRGRVVYY